MPLPVLEELRSLTNFIFFLSYFRLNMYIYALNHIFSEYDTTRFTWRCAYMRSNAVDTVDDIHVKIL